MSLEVYYLAEAYGVPKNTMNGDEKILIEKNFLPSRTLMMDILGQTMKTSTYLKINFHPLPENVDDLKFCGVYFKILDTFFKI